ncbi:hypothetical protein IAQ61_003096 [Plenodomus lingam]|uniref:uncharacterized protein n=1 Tax=Leptosphaeria maculans TaxID=5022 RepID=UPI0033218B93|nr:hypothetical protein IAQ61_003096 [Plenodomus lingam]
MLDDRYCGMSPIPHDSKLQDRPRLMMHANILGHVLHDLDRAEKYAVQIPNSGSMRLLLWDGTHKGRRDPDESLRSIVCKGIWTTLKAGKVGNAKIQPRH